MPTEQSSMAATTAHSTCPWWLGYLLASPVRRIFQPPTKLLAPHIRPGMTVLEPGPGMGFFTLDLMRLTGPGGRVLAVDIEPRMLASLRRRAAEAGLLDRLETRLATADSLGLGSFDGAIDFTLAFAMVHELPAPEPFFHQAARASKPGARLLLVEPKGHVTAALFERELRAARDAGFTPVPTFATNHPLTALLEKTGA